MGESWKNCALFICGEICVQADSSLKRIERVDIIPEFRTLFHLLFQVAKDQGSRIHPCDFPGKTFTWIERIEKRSQVLYAADDYNYDYD